MVGHLIRNLRILGLDPIVGDRRDQMAKKTFKSKYLFVNFCLFPSPPMFVERDRLVNPVVNKKMMSFRGLASLAKMMSPGAS